MSSDPNWPSRYSHPTRAAKRANLAEKVAWALKDAQAEIDSLTVLLGQAQKDRARLTAAAREALTVLTRLADSAAYWSDYDVPVGIVAEIDAAKARLAGVLNG